MSATPIYARVMLKFFLLSFFILLQTPTFCQDFDAEVINYTTNIKLANGKLITTENYEVKINNRSGEKYTHISIPSSQLLKTGNIEAFITDASGTVVKKLKNKDIIEKSAISSYSFYEDDYVKEFSLKHNTYPYTIHYSYQFQENQFIYLAYWTPVVYKDIPTRKANLTVDIPLSIKIKSSAKLINDSLITTTDERVIFKWTADYSDLINEENFSPPLSEFFPTVKIVPETFFYEKEGNTTNWKTLGKWTSEINEGLNNLPENEKRTILFLTKNCTNTKEKIRILYHYLQDQTRYINVSIETGGFKPYPASYVAQNKYGDCKALSNYFKTVLEVIGVKSYYTIIWAGSSIKEVDTSFVAPQFNHIILYIPDKENDIWLDCTSDAAFDYLGTFTQNRYALIIDSNNSYLKKTPALKANDVLETRTIKVKYTPQITETNFQEILKGEMYETVEQLNRLYSEEDKRKITRKYFLNDGHELTNYKINIFDRDSTKIEFIQKTSSSNIYMQYGNDIIIKNIPFQISSLKKPKDRILPIQIDYPIYKIDTINYEMPDGYLALFDTPKYEITAKFGSYQYFVKEENGNIKVVKKLLIHSGHYPLSEYNDFYNFIKDANNMEQKINISLKKK